MVKLYQQLKPGLTDPAYLGAIMPVKDAPDFPKTVDAKKWLASEGEDGVTYATLKVYKRIKVSKPKQMHIEVL